MSLFKEGSGTQSIMRVMSILCVVSAIVYAFVNHDIAMVGLLLTYGFGGKVIQKKLEAK